MDYATRMDFVGKIPGLGEAPGDATGNLYWASEDSPNPGLYMWTGKENALLVSREHVRVLTHHTEEEPR